MVTTNALGITSSGLTTYDGLGVFTSTPYATGSFTPALAFGGASTSITYTARSGTYTRIGTLVAITVYIELSNKGSSTGNATISGLPLTASGDSFGMIGQVDTISLPYLYYVGAFNVGSGTTLITLYASNSTGSGLQNLTQANFNNTSIMRFQSIYFT